MYLPSVWKVSGFEPSFMNFIFYHQTSLKRQQKTKIQTAKILQKSWQTRPPINRNLIFSCLVCRYWDKPRPKKWLLSAAYLWKHATIIITLNNTTLICGSLSVPCNSRCVFPVKIVFIMTLMTPNPFTTKPPSPRPQLTYQQNLVFNGSFPLSLSLSLFHFHIINSRRLCFNSLWSAKSKRSSISLSSNANLKKWCWHSCLFESLLVALACKCKQIQTQPKKIIIIMFFFFSPYF